MRGSLSQIHNLSRDNKSIVKNILFSMSNYNFNYLNEPNFDNKIV